jgi:UDP-N-acetylglucosamine 2-epimerase (non-hydrolysing)
VTPPLITHIVGARPNFMKAAPVISALDERAVPQVLIHTGQHYDERMSEVFFRDLGMPEPDLNLGVGSGSHAGQTAALLTALEDAIGEIRPTCVVVYGDVNSTLAAALLCSKVHVPLIHVEAGLRSFDRTMPEEVNRVLTDAVADLLLITSPEAYAHLADEGVAESKIRFVGNPMIDTLLKHRPRFDDAAIRERLTLPDDFGVVTLHRPANVDDPQVAKPIIEALSSVSDRLPLIIPLHPRGRQRLADLGLVSGPRLQVLDPLGYLEFMALVAAARLVITDSGGIQEETTVLGVPCLTLRPNTERPITISHGTNRLTDAAHLCATVESTLGAADGPPADGPPLWDGRAGVRCADEILRFLATS